jgi:PEP-CTERM motif
MSIKLTNSRRLFVTTVAAGLLAWTHGTANATLLPGEGVGLYTDLDSGGENTDQGDEVFYNSTVGVIGPVTAPGVTTVFAPTFPFYTPVLTTTPGTLEPGAVSAGLSLVTGPDQATVSASLATGSIKTYLTGTALTALQPVETDGYTTGILSDGLTWQVAGGGAAAVTISVHVDGTLENANLNIFTQYLALRIEGTTEETMSFQGDSASGPFGISTQTLQSANQNWVSEAFSNESATGFDFTGVFDVTNAEYTPFYMSFEIAPCGYGLTCDFQDTAQVSLALPTGVSYSSDSGSFLSSPATPVPEPGTFTLLAVGAVGAAFARRRQILAVFFLSKSFSKSPNCGRHTGLASA